MLLTKNLPRDKPLARPTATIESRCCYIHPHVFPDRDPAKGRFLRATDAIPEGTVLFVDTAYAIVPTVSPDGQSSSICSNLACSRGISQRTTAVHCPKGCITDVAWCNRSCRVADSARHDYECLWLRRNAQTIQQQERQYDFATIWHVVRLLAGWSLEARRQPLKRPSELPGGFKDSWEAVELCCDYLDSWPKSQLEHWVRLIETYLAPQSGLPYLPSPEKLLSLICKEETNTFGLYPRVTGLLNTTDAQASRGECYGFGLYPRAAMFNHTCFPNVSFVGMLGRVNA